MCIELSGSHVYTHVITRVYTQSKIQWAKRLAALPTPGTPGVPVRHVFRLVYRNGPVITHVSRGYRLSSS